MSGMALKETVSFPSARPSHPDFSGVTALSRADGPKSRQLRSHTSQSQNLSESRKQSCGWHCQSHSLRTSRCKHICNAGLSGTAEAGGTKVGFCGIGIMGLAMAKNLINAGYQVTVWNRSADKCKPLEDLGAKVASNPKALAEQSDVVLAMLADPAAAEDVAQGIAQGIGEGKGYVDISTIDGDTANRIKEMIHQSGGQYLEAPVSGSKQPAEQGTLIFLCAGDKDLFDFASPLLDVMGKAKYYLGEVGNGANMKLVVNMVMGTMMASFAEGLALADKAGLSPEDFIEVSGISAIAAPMFGLKGPSMKDHKYPAAFPLKHQRKDLELALKYAGSRDQSLPVAAATTDLFKKAEADGHGDSDFSAILEAVRQ